MSITNWWKPWSKRLNNLDCVITIQGSPGNWDYDTYMHGMYNGLVLARSIMDGTAGPEFRDAPDKWIAPDTDVELREEYPNLQRAYEEYHIIKKLVEKV